MKYIILDDGLHLTGISTYNLIREDKELWGCVKFGEEGIAL